VASACLHNICDPQIEPAAIFGATFGPQMERRIGTKSDVVSSKSGSRLVLTATLCQWQAKQQGYLQPAQCQTHQSRSLSKGKG
jgi:hypothetical protein